MMHLQQYKVHKDVRCMFSIYSIEERPCFRSTLRHLVTCCKSARVAISSCGLVSRPSGVCSLQAVGRRPSRVCDTAVVVVEKHSSERCGVLVAPNLQLFMIEFFRAHHHLLSCKRGAVQSNTPEASPHNRIGSFHDICQRPAPACSLCALPLEAESGIVVTGTLFMCLTRVEQN